MTITAWQPGKKKKTTPFGVMGVVIIMMMMDENLRLRFGAKVKRHPKEKHTA